MFLRKFFGKNSRNETQFYYQQKNALKFKLGKANAETGSKCTKAVDIPDANLEEEGDKFYNLISSKGIKLVNAE